MDLSEAIRTHVEWKMRLRGAMKSEALLDAGTMERDDHCHFGRWLHGEARDKYGQLKSYPECVRVHAEFHRHAAGVAQAINQKNFLQAHKLLDACAPLARVAGAMSVAIGVLKREARI